MRRRVAYSAAVTGLVLFTGALVALSGGDPLTLLACAVLGAGVGWVLADDYDE